MARNSKVVGGGMSAGTVLSMVGDMQDNVTAAGTTQATAALIYGDNVIITTAAASSGVIIGGPTFTPGDEMVIFNLGANTVLVYPPLGGIINALSANAGFSIAAGKSATLIARSSVNFVAAASA